MSEIIDQLMTKFSSLFSGLSMEINHYHFLLVTHLGEKLTNGVYLCAAIIILLIVFKIFKLAFNLLRYVVIPTLIIAYAATTFFSVSFLSVTPIAGSAFSLLYFIKS